MHQTYNSLAHHFSLPIRNQKHWWCILHVSIQQNHLRTINLNVCRNFVSFFSWEGCFPLLGELCFRWILPTLTLNSAPSGVFQNLCPTPHFSAPLFPCKLCHWEVTQKRRKKNFFFSFPKYLKSRVRKMKWPTMTPKGNLRNREDSWGFLNARAFPLYIHSPRGRQHPRSGGCRGLRCAYTPVETANGIGRLPRARGNTLCRSS